MDRFLLQVNGDVGYAEIANNRSYINPVWMNDRRTKDQGDVKLGDEILVYCTGSVPEYGMTLAFSVVVREVGDDQTVLSFDEPRFFQSPLSLPNIQAFVAQGKLGPIFKRCGTQGFNFAKLLPGAAEQALKLLDTDPSNDPDVAEAQAGSPADRLIEIHLEQWLVDHWDLVNFGAPLKLYEEDGEVVGQQYNTGSVGQIDLLCEDTSSGALVVIELKRGQQSDKAIGQLARYMGWVKDHLANDREVQGVILTPSYDERLRYAIKVLQGGRLLRYQTKFEVFPEDP